MAADPGLEPLFAGRDPAVRATYDRVVATLRGFGELREEPKKSSVHLVRSSGFAGAHPRKSSLVLNLRLDRPLETPRLVKSEQVSRNRYHNEIRLTAPDDVDAELTGWLRAAYDLG